MRERAQHLTDRPRRRAHTFPNAAVIDRNTGQQKPGVAQPGEVGGDQLTPPLALAALSSEVGGYRSEVFMHNTGIHRDFSLQRGGTASTPSQSYSAAPIIGALFLRLKSVRR